MRNRTGFSLTALALFAPAAFAGGGTDDLGKVQIPALKAIDVSYKPGKGITFDGGDEFSLTIYNRLQVQYAFLVLDNNVADVSTFAVRRGRTKFKGHVFDKKTNYMMNVEWSTGGNNILDFWVSHEAWSNDEWGVNVRAGAGKTQYGIEATGSSNNLEFVERSLATSTFANTRATGALAMARGMENKLRIHAGVFNTDTAGGSPAAAQNGINADNELNYTGGVRYDLHKDGGEAESYAQGDLERRQDWDATLAGNIWLGNERAGGQDIDVFAYTVGGAFKGWGIHGLAEFFSYSADPDVGAKTDAMGWNIQGSYALEQGWGFGGRASMVTIDDNASFLTARTGTPITLGAVSGDVTEFTFGVNKFWNNHARKIQGDVTFQEVNPDGGTPSSSNILFRVMFTLAI